MEVALTDVCKDIRVGKILIQSDPSIPDPGFKGSTKQFTC